MPLSSIPSAARPETSRRRSRAWRLLLAGCLALPLAYEPLLHLWSAVVVRPGRDQYPALVRGAHVQSEHYRLQYVQDHASYYADSARLPFTTKLVDDPETGHTRMAAFPRTAADAGVDPADTAPEIARFPRGHYTFEAHYPARGGPLSLVKFERHRFEWPSPCPFILVPICGGLTWYGDAYFELLHQGEALRFRLPTMQHAFLGFDAQVFRYAVDEETVFLEVTQSNNEVERELGWYRVVPR